jgi:hypothetical protein
MFITALGIGMTNGVYHYGGEILQVLQRGCRRETAAFAYPKAPPQLLP